MGGAQAARAAVLTARSNISAAVGHIAFFGVSVPSGVVLVSSIRRGYDGGLAARKTIARGVAVRFRPILVSGIVAVIGFLPAALSRGIGTEIQRSLARMVHEGWLPPRP